MGCTPEQASNSALLGGLVKVVHQVRDVCRQPHSTNLFFYFIFLCIPDPRLTTHLQNRPHHYDRQGSMTRVQHFIT